MISKPIKSVPLQWLNLENMTKTTKYVLVKRFEGLPVRTDLELQEEELPSLRDGGKYNFWMFSKQSTIITFCYPLFVNELLYI